MPNNTYKKTIFYLLVNFIRPDIPKLILLALISSLFLILESNVYHLPPLQDCPISAHSTKLTGLPFSFYTSDRLENSSFQIVSLLLNIIIYYLITCTIVHFFRFGIEAYSTDNKGRKLAFVAIAANVFVIAIVTTSILSQDWLVRAVRSQTMPAVKFILSMGANPNSISLRRHHHALHESVRHDNADLTKVLLSYGASTITTDHQGQTALHLAASRNAINAARQILKYGTDTELRDQNGKTAAHFACSTEMAKLLIKYKAKSNTLDVHGKQPSDYSRNPALKAYWRSIQKGVKQKPAKNVAASKTEKKPFPQVKVKKLKGCATNLRGTLFAHGKRFQVTSDKQGTITAYTGLHGFAYAACPDSGYYHIVVETKSLTGKQHQTRYTNLYHEGEKTLPLSFAKEQTALIQLKIGTGNASIHWYFSKGKIKNLASAIKSGKISEINRNKLIIKTTKK